MTEAHINLLHAEGRPDDEGRLEIPHLPETIRIWHDDDGRWLDDDEWSRVDESQIRLNVRGDVRVCQTRDVAEMDDDGDF